MKNKFSLSVSDFAIPAPLLGSIDTHSGFSEGKEIGMQLHKEIQARRVKEHPSYNSEVFIRHEFKYKNYIFNVAGRLDGIYQKQQVVIEEIKSSFNLNKLYTYINNEINIHPFCLQLLTYGYIHWIKNKEIPLLNLHLVSSRNKESLDLGITLDINNYESWLNRRFIDLEQQILNAKKRIKSRKKVAAQFNFPYSKARVGQIELVETIQKGFEKEQSMLIQAPTGLGKTVGVLYPALKEALARGQKVIYVTPKNSQHLVAQDAVKKLQEQNLNNSMTLTAKSKLCFKSQSICNKEYCDYAKEYYTKVRENNLIEKLGKIKNLTCENFRQMGLEYEVCPFELQMDNIENIDTIICDYNYVFSSQAAKNRIGKIFLGEKEKPNLIIDEFHNLPERGMSYYSPILSAFTLKNWLLAIKKIDLKFRRKVRALLLEGSNLITNSGDSGVLVPHKITPPIADFKKMEAHLREFLSEYLESDVEIEKDDIILNLFNYWKDFTAALEFVEEASSEFFVSYYPSNHTIKITCCDASAMLKKCYDSYSQIIGFSATLKPFDFYSKLSGLHDKKLQTVEVLSPFPKSNRKLIIIPQVSSKYSERLRNYPRIAEIIEKISNLKKGNYFIFFPSFEFLQKVLEIFPITNDYKVLSQKRNMSFQDVQQLLDQLRDDSCHHIIFAVQGGILAEGIDYPGKMIIGAMIIGVPLPVYDWEREQMKSYYELKYNAGVDYAYIFPAMAKSVQSSGRVIRSEQDKGIIVLMDYRFLQESCIKCMPHDWVAETPQELISKSILNDINYFWTNDEFYMA